MRRFLVLLSFLFSLSLCAQTKFVHTLGKNLIAPDGSKLVLHGTNVGNWMVPEGYMFHFDGGPQAPREIEALVNLLLGPEDATKFWHEYRDQYVTEEDIKFQKSLGFNVVRIPIHYKFFAPGNTEGFALLDRVIEWSHKAGLYVIIDLHAAPGGQTGTNIDDSWGYPWLFESAEAQQETIDLWERIAKYYSDNPTVLGYDLLNEPIPNIPQIEKYNSALEPLYRRIVSAVRKVDKNHIVILGGAQWDSNFKVFGAPFDDNVMYTCHKYWTAPVQGVIQPYIDFRDKHNVPIWMGETGENKDEWIAEFAKLLNANEVSWTFWPYKKMDARSSITSFSRPEHWDDIVKFAKESQTMGNAKNLIQTRPSVDDSRGKGVAILESSDIWQARSDYNKARAEDERLDRTFKRTKLLFEHKVLSEREFEDAQANASEARAELDRASARLRLLGASLDNNSNQISLPAPIPGTVLSIGASTGEISKSTDNSDAICTIADLSTIWILGDVYEKDLASVQPGSSVEIAVSAYPGETWTGRVAQVSDAVDPATRTLKLRIVMPNPGRKLKPDMFATIRVRRHQSQAMLIPAAAVLHEGGDTAVMVETSAGKYERRLIQERPLNDHETVVVSGLKSGEQVVTEGAALLRGGGEN